MKLLGFKIVFPGPEKPLYFRVANDGKPAKVQRDVAIEAMMRAIKQYIEENIEEVREENQ